MCITIEEAKLTKTIIYSAEAIKPDGKKVHVIGYQNNVENSSGPNAMLLPFPASGTIGRENLVNGSSFKDILKEYNKALDRRDARKGRNLTLSKDALDDFDVFESGSYTIVLVQKPSDLLFALQEVPENKRPTLSIAFVAKLQKLYPYWPIALCCFDSSFEAEPLFWWYEPKDNSQLFAPAIDAHDGNPPNTEINVKRDHTLVFSLADSEATSDPGLEQYINSNVPDEHQWMFSSKIKGLTINRSTQNGDFILDKQNFNRVVIDVKVQIP